MTVPFPLESWPGRFARTVTVVIAVAALQPQVARAADPTATEEPQQSEDMDEIVVTGTPPPGSVIGDIPPENQLNRMDIASYGVSTINDLLDEISDLTQSDQGRDSSSAPIILVNGKRVSSVNEVGDLPTESIFRVDILPEEVALKYGYGAQQKVVNIILRRFFQARVADLTGGEATQGEGGNETGDFSYSRIRNNDRLNVVGRIKSQDSILESDRGVSSNADAIGDDSHARTLEPATRAYTVNGVVAHPFSDTLSASFNAKATYQTSRSLDGFPSANLDVPASSPYAHAAGDSTIDRFLSADTLRQDVDTTGAHAGVTLNQDLPRRWRLSMIGNYDHVDTQTETDRGYDVTGLQAGIDAGDIDPYGPLPVDELGVLRRQDARSITDTGGASVLANGKLVALPAGDLTTSIKIGADYSSLDATRTAAEDRSSSRGTGSGQVSLSVPLTSRANNVLPAIGNLSANVTGALTHVSRFGSLDTLGYGLNWTPHQGVSFIASINEDRQAPTLSQLGDPLVTTSNLSVYDQVTGQTVTVTRVSGGNPDLQADDRHVLKVGATLAPISSPKTRLSVTANYIHSVTRNAIGTLRGATPETQAAFPDRFERDADGVLTSVDSRPVNFDREEREEVRWGFNLTHVIRAPTRPNRPPGAGAQWMRNRQSPPAGAQRGTQGEPAVPLPPPASAEEAARPAPSAYGANPPDPPPGDVAAPGEAAPSGGSGSDGPRPPRDGGGFGQFGGAGRRSGAGGSGGGNGAQFQVSAYHTWYFHDDVRLSAGGPSIDLLNGGTIGSGGQARHKVQLNAGWLDNGLGLRFSGNWVSATQTLDNGAGSGPLSFSSLATFDVRLIANLQQRFLGKTWARGTRLTLELNNVFDARQDIRDGTGATPGIYQPAFLDPHGRTVSLAFRRLF
jgi:iron complex outermembrane receptor protein